MRLFLALLLAPFGGVVSAALITFEGRTASISNGDFFTTIDDFKFTLNKGGGFSQNQGSISIGDSDGIRVSDPSGPHNLALLGGFGFKPVLTLERSDGNAFSLGAIDVGGSSLTNTARWAETVQISNGSESYDVTLNTSETTYQTVAAQSIFSNVTALTFQGVSSGSLAEFTLDNINVGEAVTTTGNNQSPVPEPSTLLILVVMLVGTMIFHRRYDRRLRTFVPWRAA